MEGEAGVAKSHLLAEVRSTREVASLRALAGRCHELREPCPLGPFVEELRKPR